MTKTMIDQSDTTLADIPTADATWDVIVVGGGVTGGAVFREAVRMGLRTLLLEQNDFAWGTSSRSSKMVHGGLRYLKEGKLMLTRASVGERERLLSEAPGLVDPLGFLMPIFKDIGPSRMMMGAGLAVYSLMALEKQYTGYGPAAMQKRVPHLRTENLAGGFYFKDAQVDDARLVLRLIQEGVANGGKALNYTRVHDIHRDSSGRVAGVTAQDAETEAAVELKAGVVINAGGVWAEFLHPSPEKGLHIRPLRGSHLIFPRSVFPVNDVVSFMHPEDERPVFMFPWEGCAVLGTTDIDHSGDLYAEPVISRTEIDYLMAAMAFIMPGLPLSEQDCIASMAGIRPVLSRGKASASHESREHVVWEDKGLVTVTGGKLTTFRLLARDALKKAKHYLPSIDLPSSRAPVFDSPQDSGTRMPPMAPDVRQRLTGRYGNAAVQVAEDGDAQLLSPVPGTETLWAELAYAAAHEQVRHLTDLLLRRVRVGILLPDGAAAHLDRVDAICRPLLSWDEARWEREKEHYLREWRDAYAPPHVLGI
ncbi:MAG: glycerol-3-phosphate dehydrogenase/oxidase [Thermodesulfobacteriota bacterium]|nr:glycerol-3-phosphate dehydrogenase/oxidase [Thermodesulfobacteriota bacterium]